MKIRGTEMENERERGGAVGNSQWQGCTSGGQQRSWSPAAAGRGKEREGEKEIEKIRERGDKEVASCVKHVSGVRASLAGRRQPREERE